VRFSIIPFLLLAIPLAEIAVFVVVGQQIGLLPTLGLVIATAMAGSLLLRVQGFALLSRMQRELAEGRMPARDLVHGVMILLAGILLLMPGFVTDTLGLLLFIPAMRDAAWRFIRSRVIITGGEEMRGTQRPETRDKTIDLDLSDYSSSSGKDSPWGQSDDRRE